MTKRRNELNSQRNYEQAIQTLEKTRPQGCDYKIFSENGSQSGKIIYTPSDDTLTIVLETQNINLKGEYLCSIYQALQDLFSEAEG